MKTFIAVLLVGSSLFTLNGQIATAHNADLALIDSSSKTINRTIAPTNAKTVISLNQLSTKISESLSKNDLLRRNHQSCSLILEISIDEIGTMDDFKISKSNSELMSQIVLHYMETCDTMLLDIREFKRVSRIKIPFRYSL